MAITPLPTPPSSADPAGFNAAADAFLGALPGFGAELDALGTQAQADAAAADASAAAAAASQTSAALSANTASGSANFKGAWSALSGPLARPAAVLHAGSYWLLLADLADVTAAQPGVSASWAAYTPSEPTVLVNANAAATLGALHLVNGNYTVTLPAAPQDGMRCKFRDVTAAGTTWAVNPNGAAIETGAAGEVMTVDIPFFNFELRYSGSLARWVLL